MQHSHVIPTKKRPGRVFSSRGVLPLNYLELAAGASAAAAAFFLWCGFLAALGAVAAGAAAAGAGAAAGAAAGASAAIAAAAIPTVNKAEAISEADLFMSSPASE